ncbi:MAG: WecB/TagA/CpsF family glycosyltransferase [Cyclobacteriaceae bacterium]
MQRAGLEWLFRLITEPQRLWKRYLETNSFFLYLFFKETLFSNRREKTIV